jgi:hypothetical protein
MSKSAAAKVIVTTELYLYGKITAVKETESLQETRTSCARVAVMQVDGGRYKGKHTIDYGNAKPPSVSGAIIGVRAIGKEEMDADGALIGITELKFTEDLLYDPQYYKEELDALIERASSVWADVKDADEWIREIRRRR